MKVKITLVLIIILASLVRLWGLSEFPAGFNADEAAIGYNAYSLLLTGKDEYGQAFPLTFKSFGDYKPGLYFYFVMPFVATLGLNELAVRFPSALLGIATVFLTYLLAKEIFQNYIIALVSAFLLAISPWHIHFSRGGWESNAATFLLSLGVLFFVKSFAKNFYLILSLLAFLLAVYTYQSPRLLVPVLLFFFLLFYKKVFLTKIKALGKYLPILVILALPLFFQFASGQGSSRFSGLSFLSDIGPALRVNELRGEHQNPDSFSVKMLHNKVIAYGTNFLGHYLDHFNPDFLFINGDPLIRNKAPEVGEFYLLESIFLIIGLVFLAISQIEHKKILIIWLLIAPLASAMTYQTPHALRALNMVVPLTLIIGFGWGSLLIKLKNKARLFVFFLPLLFLSFEFVHYLDAYFIHYPKRYPLAWEYGFREMVQKVQTYQNQYQQVVITDRYDQPYILVLFYEKYDPVKYQPQALLSPRDKFNFGTVRSFDKYQFKTINPQEISDSEGVLFVGTPSEIPENATIIDKIAFPNGESAFIFAKK